MVRLKCPLRAKSTEWFDRSDFRRESHFLSRKSRTAFTVASGCSSMIQCPEFAMMPPSTLAPTSRMIAACWAGRSMSGNVYLARQYDGQTLIDLARLSQNFSRLVRPKRTEAAHSLNLRGLPAIVASNIRDQRVCAASKFCRILQRSSTLFDLRRLHAALVSQCRGQQVQMLIRDQLLG
jgi:hypothetical protein